MIVITETNVTTRTNFYVARQQKVVPDAPSNIGAILACKRRKKIAELEKKRDWCVKFIQQRTLEALSSDNDYEVRRIMEHVETILYPALRNLEHEIKCLQR